MKFKIKISFFKKKVNIFNKVNKIRRLINDNNFDYDCKYLYF